MKYRKKPVVIEAVQFGEDVGPLIQWLDKNGVLYEPYHDEHGRYVSLEIPTMEGVMRADRGDWIIKGVQGEFYPCKPDIFEQTYEPC